MSKNLRSQYSIYILKTLGKVIFFRNLQQDNQSLRPPPHKINI